MNHEQLLAVVGPDWRALATPSPGTHVPAKFMEREKQLIQKHALAHRHLSEYLTARSPSSVVDFSCGNGALLEVLRAYGHTVLGVEIQYGHFHDSQALPVVRHDCRALPFPLPDRSADLVACIGAITFYGDQPWGMVLDEFARIARRTVLVVANNGHVLEAHRHEAEAWTSPGWARSGGDGRTVFKWVQA